MNSYISHLDYLRSTTGQETASLVGVSAFLSTLHAAGATMLSITKATTVDLLQNDPITLFDGSSSEVTLLSADTAAGATHLPIQAGTVFQHPVNTPLCSDGAKGSLAGEILTASDMVEDECLQSLLLGTQVDTLSLQTMQASIGNDGVLTVRPLYFPVQTITSAVFANGVTTVSFDASQASIELGQQVVIFRSLVPTGNPTGSPFGSQLNQRTRGTVTLTYTSGFAYALLPPRVKKACVLYVSDLLSKRRNPTGGTHVASGKVTVKYGHIGDTSGESDLIKNARNLLSSFKREAF